MKKLNTRAAPQQNSWRWHLACLFWDVTELLLCIDHGQFSMASKIQAVKPAGDQEVRVSELVQLVFSSQTLNFSRYKPLLELGC